MCVASQKPKLYRNQTLLSMEFWYSRRLSYCKNLEFGILKRSASSLLQLRVCGSQLNTFQPENSAALWFLILKVIWVFCAWVLLNDWVLLNHWIGSFIPIFKGHCLNSGIRHVTPPKSRSQKRNFLKNGLRVAEETRWCHAFCSFFRVPECWFSTSAAFYLHMDTWWWFQSLYLFLYLGR